MFLTSDKIALHLTIEFGENLTVGVISRRFRRKSTTLTVVSFFRQFNAIGPLFFICSTSWLRGYPDFLGSETLGSRRAWVRVSH